jgi:hypothetical protein
LELYGNRDGIRVVNAIRVPYRLKLATTTIVVALRWLKSGSQRKHVLRWIYSLRKDYLLEKPLPWINFDAIDFLEKYAQLGWYVFEYGSGGSTLYWMKKRMNCISVEHDPRWYQVVSDRLQGNNLVDYRLILPDIVKEPLEELDPSDPYCYASNDPHYKGHDFRHYVTQIDGFPDKHFDLILIDGRARPSCIMHSIPKVKDGGIILLDNSDREYYIKHVAPLLNTFVERRFLGITPTTLEYTQSSAFTKVPINTPHSRGSHQ